MRTTRLKLLLLFFPLHQAVAALPPRIRPLMSGAAEEDRKGMNLSYKMEGQSGIVGFGGNERGFQVKGEPFRVRVSSANSIYSRGSHADTGEGHYRPNIPFCGKGPTPRTVKCWNLSSGGQLSLLPLPGELTTTPVLYQQSWYFSTDKGFLIKVPSTGLLNRGFPTVGVKSLSFWGQAARLSMKSLDELQKEQKLTPESVEKYGWSWAMRFDESLIGRPVFYQGLVIFKSVSGRLLGINTETGKLLWSHKLERDSTDFVSTGLGQPHISARTLFIGSSTGELHAIDIQTGKRLWVLPLPNFKTEKVFRGIKSRVTTDSSGLFVAARRGHIWKVDRIGRKIMWSYPSGTYSDLHTFQGNILFGNNSGEFISLSGSSGKENFKKLIFANSPLVSVIPLQESRYFALVSGRGEIALSTPDGKVLHRHSVRGEPNTDVFKFAIGQNEAFCMSFSRLKFKCFTIDQGFSY